jgi:AAA domain
MPVNPFVWGRPLDDVSKIVGMDGFAREVALILKAQTNVAIFGPRDTGKTTFTTQLAQELAQDHGADAPPHTVVRVNLQRAFSIPAFTACVHDALQGHPDAAVRREARRQLSRLEKEIGFDIKVIKGSIRTTRVDHEQATEALHAQLASLQRIADHLVVIFDEFQILRRCPGSPLSIIRSALMGPEAGNVSLLLTGSIRAALQMMLESSSEPIFGEVAQKQLPEITHADFFEFLEFNFEATGKPASEEAIDHLLNLTRRHPKRTQQLAWAVWNSARPSTLPVGIELVDDAYEEMVMGTDALEFESIVQTLTSGDDAQTNEARALFLLADRGGSKPTSRQNVALYGFTNASLVVPALERLDRRALAQRRKGGDWELVDPIFEGWLRRHSPLALKASDLD